MARSIKGHISSGINYKMLIYFGLKCREYIENSTPSNPEAKPSFPFFNMQSFTLNCSLEDWLCQFLFKRLLKFKKTESMSLPITEIFLKQNALFLRDDKADTQVLTPFPEISIFH